jgi:hypothetical protein
VVAVGLHDIDGDGCPDAWFSRGGKNTIAWGNGKGGFTGKQELAFGDTAKGLSGGKCSFLDVDSDKQLDILFEKAGGDAVTTQTVVYGWTKLAKAGK